MVGAAQDVRLALVERLTARDRVRSEATIQADVRALLMDPELGLDGHDLVVDLETQVGDRRRIDVEVGCTVIEVKRDLRGPRAITEATTQLAGYVVARTEQTGQRYVGVLTDGLIWIAFHEVEGTLREATRHDAARGTAGAAALLGWLEGVLATRRDIAPLPHEIRDRLGATSSSHDLDLATLKALYDEHHTLPTVALKRQLWASLLRSALGTQFPDTDELFLEHTLLVGSAEIIAHLALEVDATSLEPATLLTGARFDEAGIYGVVERDFFDWILEVPGGDGFVRALARRLARFDWGRVEHDVLKVLYESVIGADTRKKLGEYYTPDWLAEHVVDTVVTDPLSQRALDPACGSGTFLFHAVRRFLSAAEEAGLPQPEALARLSSHVIGVDLHPVAVALARVTYLLAIGRDRLNAPRGDLTVAVYLGDSVGWQHRSDLLSSGELVIATETGARILEGELRFPDQLLADAARFDQIVMALTEESGRAAHQPTSKLSAGARKRLALSDDEYTAMNTAFVRLRELHEDSRNHIWSYYIRNLARPAWLARPENRVDVLLGNPPWLSYRHMPRGMQTAFKSMSIERALWLGDSSATHQDLAALFVSRAIQQYLRPGGRFGFVMPNAVVDRDYWSGFRSGDIGGQEGTVHVAYDQPWDLRRLRPHFFPRAACVVLGTLSSTGPVPMPRTAQAWAGQLPKGRPSWSAVDDVITRGDVPVHALAADGTPGQRSPYASRFAQGASIVPRVLFMVEPAPVTSLGTAHGRRPVRSARSSTEKPPWKGLDAVTGTVETQFVRSVLLGESVLPFRVRTAREAVLPVDGSDLLHGRHDRLDLYPGLADWVRRTETLWMAHRSSERLSLTDQLDFRRKLTQQLPAGGLRVVYGKAGMHVAAAVVTDPRAVIDHKLYWAAVATHTEATYLATILNAPVLTELVRPLMSYGKDERDVDKHVWKLPIPAYDRDDPAHVALAQIGSELADAVASLTFDSSNFVTQRRAVRVFLANHPLADELNSTVKGLLAS